MISQFWLEVSDTERTSEEEDVRLGLVKHVVDPTWDEEKGQCVLILVST